MTHDGPTDAAVEEFLQGVDRHVRTGRAILKELVGSPIVCPPLSHEGYADWLVAGQVLSTLYEGIAVLEVRLDIFAPRCAESESTSGIRKWRGLDQQF
jgi:hypothetical protein